ncbi:MAG: LysR family transcriptional regulator [Oscillospiraceae bacterium]|jgi:protein-tyrosine phosphatase|nr:LysR family transcriptional regulator [Oscillospiraceae bacterium]MBQ1792416.1 LysR family transcriptional regulator [Oscillospiraceae bacterium]
MTIQQLTVFLAVCEDLNYTRAAARVFMSRQAVRQNISELEQELSGHLFHNDRNRLSLTAKGRLLRDKAEPIVRDFRELKRIMNADIRIERPLRLGLSVALVPDYLPRLGDHIKAFTASYPNLPIEQILLDNDDAVPAMMAGAADACIVMDLGSCRPGTERYVLTSHKPAVLMRESNPLSRRDKLSPQDLSSGELFVPGYGEEMRPLLDAIGIAGAEPVVKPSFYQVLYHILDHGGMALNRFDPGESIPHSRTRNILLQGLPPLCSSFVTVQGQMNSPILLLRDWLQGRLREDFKLAVHA